MPIREMTEVLFDQIRKEQDFEVKYATARFGKHTLNYVDSGRVSQKRISTLFTKEPTTILWLDTFKPEDFFYDVGANVGTYSIFAAKVRGCRVCSFEPESLNYADLNKNIWLNGLYDKVRAYCCAVSHSFAMDDLYLSRFCPSFSHHDFAERRYAGHLKNLVESAEARLPQGCLSISLDEMHYERRALPPPTHIKIDVDGLESQVIVGARRLLSTCESLKTVLIETDFHIQASLDLIDKMKGWGWTFSMDQVCWDGGKTGGRLQTPEQWHEQMAKGKGGCNIIWFKDPAYAELFRVEAEAWFKNHGTKT